MDSYTSLNVSIYDAKHESLLANTSNYREIKELVKGGFQCTHEDFWTYSMFRKQDSRIAGRRTYSDLKAKLMKWWSIIEDDINLDSSTITAINEGRQDSLITELVGIGGALSIVSHIHNLIHPDWYNIEDSQEKDLDYYIATDGGRIIQVEAKGVYLESIKKTASVSKKAGQIRDKKSQKRTTLKSKGDICYGVITGYTANPTITAHSWILDPPVLYDFEDPRKLRILSRLSFYLDQLNEVSRSQYLIALANRIRDIRILDNYNQLDTQPLINRLGEPFEVPDSYRVSRTTILSERGFGEIFPVNLNRYFFFGLELRIVDILISQNFPHLLEYRCNLPSRLQVAINAKVRTQLLDESRISYSNFQRTPDGSRAIIPLTGTLHINSAGVIFGSLLPVTDISNEEFDYISIQGELPLFNDDES